MVSYLNHQQPFEDFWDRLQQKWDRNNKQHCSAVFWQLGWHQLIFRTQEKYQITEKCWKNVDFDKCLDFTFCQIFLGFLLQYSAISVFDGWLFWINVSLNFFNLSYSRSSAWVHVCPSRLKAPLVSPSVEYHCPDKKGTLPCTDGPWMTNFIHFLFNIQFLEDLQLELQQYTPLTENYLKKFMASNWKPFREPLFKTAKICWGYCSKRLAALEQKCRCHIVLYYY